MMKNNWISVKDCLPEPAKDVLISDGLDSYAVACHTVNGWVASDNLISAENYDGGAHISVDLGVVKFWKPIKGPID